MTQVPASEPLVDLQVTLATAPAPGAVAILTLHGRSVRQALESLTGQSRWMVGAARLVSFADIDQGLAVLLSPQHAELMPHGGPRVVQRLVDWLTAAGAQYDLNPDPVPSYPEASCALEAHALAALARAPSPAAISLLLAQSRLWRQWLDQRDPPMAAILSQSRSLGHLLVPPTVVVVGRPNVGKSTLTNALLGRAASIVADLPGTTRDWVAAMAELGPRESAVAVRWLDTPGLRRSDDAIEAAAIAMARRVIRDADVVIAMRDTEHDWPDDVSRPPDLWVQNKVDACVGQGSGSGPDDPLPISAARDWNTPALAAAVLRCLQLPDVSRATPWAFCPPLREALERSDTVAIEQLLASRPTG